MRLVNSQQLDIDAGANAVAHNVAASDGALYHANVHLFKDDLPCNRATALGDLTPAEATFSGYVAGQITWAAPSVADSGEVEILGTVPIFRPTDALHPNSIWGLYITDGANAKLYMCGRFDSPPLPMGDALHTITVTIRWKPATNAVVVTVS